MQDPAAAGLEQVVRGLTAASKALRLYPPSSPIPRQSVESAASSLTSLLSSEPVLSFRIVRDGLAWAGTTIAPGAPGATELADALRDHGVAELDFTPGVSADDLLVLLSAILERPEDVVARGGLSAVIQAAGVETVRVSEVALTVIDPFAAAQDEDADDFLRALASDPARVAAWLSAAAKGDPDALDSGLADLARAAGEGNLQGLIDSLKSAMASGELEVRDGLVGVGLEPQGRSRELLGRVFSQMPSGDLAKSLCGGTYGNNMLSMSTALTRLPLAEKMTEVLSQVQALLPTQGRSPKEIALLEHMLKVRASTVPEPRLTDVQPAYSQVAQFAHIDATQIDGARKNVDAEARRSDHSAVSTMLVLLDQQKDFALYSKTLESLAGMVPVLLERGELTLAARVLTELAAREARSDQPWPDLTGRLRATITEAASRRSMKALISAAAANPGEAKAAHQIMQVAGDAAAAAFVEEALAFKPDGLSVAEGIVGRRIVDMLAGAASRVQWFQVAPLVARLAREPDSRAAQAIGTLAHRSDEQTRREVALGLSTVASPAALSTLTALLSDPAQEVAVAAARAIAKSNAPGSAAALGGRLETLDVDGKDFAFGREIIAALARASDPGATAVLQKLADRKALIKRGHFAEVRGLAQQALAERAKGGGGR